MVFWTPMAVPDLHRYCGAPKFCWLLSCFHCCSKEMHCSTPGPTSIGFNDGCLWDAQPPAECSYVLAWLHFQLQRGGQDGPAPQQPAVSLNAQLRLHQIMATAAPDQAH